MTQPYREEQPIAPDPELSGSDGYDCECGHEEEGDAE
jgi:hypothetical protein